MIISGLGSEEEVRAFREVWEREIRGSRERALAMVEKKALVRAVGLTIGALAVHCMALLLVRVMFALVCGPNLHDDD